MKILFLHGWHSVPGGVKTGDTLSGIAVRQGVSLSALAAANGQLATTGFINNTSVGCAPLTLQFGVSPRSVSASYTCTASQSGCTARIDITFSGQ